MQLVAKEEVRFVPANADQARPLWIAAEVDPHDEAVRRIAPLPGERRGHRQEKLVDVPILQQSAKQARTTFGQDGGEAVGAKGVENLRGPDLFAIADGTNLGGMGQFASQSAGCRADRKNQGAHLERPILGIEVAPDRKSVV